MDATSKVGIIFKRSLWVVKYRGIHWYKKVRDVQPGRECPLWFMVWRSEIRSPNVRFSSVTWFTFDVVYPPATVKPTIRFVPLLSIMHRRNRSFRCIALCFNEFKLHGAAIHSYSTSRGRKRRGILCSDVWSGWEKTQVSMYQRLVKVRLIRSCFNCAPRSCSPYLYPR